MHESTLGKPDAALPAPVAGWVDALPDAAACFDAELQCRQANAAFAALAADFDSERLVDLVITISFYNAVVRLLGSLEIDVEPEYQPYLDEFPLPPPSPGRG